MLTAIIASCVIIALIIIVPILGNIKTPDNLQEWYTNNILRVSLICGFISLVIIWVSYFLIYS